MKCTLSLWILVFAVALPVQANDEKTPPVPTKSSEARAKTPQPRSDYYRERTPAAALASGRQMPWVLFRKYKSEFTTRVDRAHSPGESAWIDTAWVVMLLKTGIIAEQNRAPVAAATLELWDERPEGGYYGHTGLQNYVAKKHGMAVGGDLMIARTNPPQRQQMSVRRDLLKTIYLMHEFQEVLLETADRYKETVMPGYTHIRHAQPTTLGHYLMSVHDPIARSVKMLEDGYSAMSLNELGCGALAGTSLPIDRDLVSTYLGLEGLLENTNDAVSYSDGYVLVTAAATNIMTVLSRMGMEMEYWSTLEYNFLDFEIGAGSRMMPNKRSNQSVLEETATGVARTLGALSEVASMGVRIAHGDMQPMAYRVHEGTLRALDQVDRYVEPFLYQLPSMIVHDDVMLATARKGYSCSTELANEMVRSHGLDYKTAHDVVARFVVDSAAAGIPSCEASLELFQQAAQAVAKTDIDMTEARLRELLDPVYFVKVTNSRGGVAPSEVARMIADRREKLAEARARHEARLVQLEEGKARMLADLRELHEALSEKKQP